MPEESAAPLRSPLHQRHVAAGAKFADFGGWSMPLEFAGGGVLAEHAAVRTAVGAFDVSHLGKISVTGPGAADFVNRCLTNDLGRITPGQAQYTLICADDGGILDDLIAYLVGPEEVFLIPNAANCALVAAQLAAAAPSGVRVADRHRDFAVLAVQGAAADQVLQGAGFPTGHGYMSFVQISSGQTSSVRVDHPAGPTTVCRTGYTGERGYELVVPVESALEVWDALVAAGEPYGLRPAGLGARDTLRTEMGYPLHGQDISSAVTPIQARLGWAVGWSKDSFFGAAALRAEQQVGPTRLLRGLRAAGRGIPRPGMTVHDGNGTEAGVVTSGTFSPTLRTGIALALLRPDLVDGDDVAVAVRTRLEPFTVTRPPFVTPAVSGG